MTSTFHGAGARGSASPPPRLHPVPYDHRDAQSLLRDLRAEQLTLYGFADRSDDTPAADFDPPAGLFVVGYLDQRPVACGGWRRTSADQAEIKRMFVRSELRGSGLGRHLLRQLEHEALAVGIRRVRLETGRLNHRALRLYTAAGYEHIPPYVPGGDPTINRALTKKLHAANKGSLPSAAPSKP